MGAMTAEEREAFKLAILKHLVEKEATGTEWLHRLSDSQRAYTTRIQSLRLAIDDKLVAHYPSDESGRVPGGFTPKSTFSITESGREYLARASAPIDGAVKDAPEWLKDFKSKTGRMTEKVTQWVLNLDEIKNKSDDRKQEITEGLAALIAQHDPNKPLGRRHR